MDLENGSLLVPSNIRFLSFRVDFPLPWWWEKGYPSISKGNFQLSWAGDIWQTSGCKLWIQEFPHHCETPSHSGWKKPPKNVGKNHLVPYFKPPEVDITWVLIPLVWGKKMHFGVWSEKKHHVGKERQHTATLCKQGSWDNTSWRILATFQPQTKAPNGSRVHDLIPRNGYPKRPSWNYRPFLLGGQFFSRSHLASSLGAISSTFLLGKVEQLRHDHYCCFMFMAVQRVTTNPLVDTTTPNEWLVCHWLLGSKLLHN